MSQAEKVLRYLKSHPAGMTQLDAERTYGIQRLGARIYDLRKRWRIESRMVLVTNRFNQWCRVARYRLVK